MDIEVGICGDDDGVGLDEDSGLPILPARTSLREPARLLRSMVYDLVRVLVADDNCVYFVGNASVLDVLDGESGSEGGW